MRFVFAFLCFQLAASLRMQADDAESEALEVNTTQVVARSSASFPKFIRHSIFGRRKKIKKTKKEKKWKRVKATVRRYPFISFMVGDAKERKFAYSRGRTMATVFPGMSSGKWPGTVAIAGVVAAGHMSFDTLAADVFTWWTKEPNDPRSRVKLRHLLTMTSGFGGTIGSHNVGTIWCLNGYPWPNVFSPENCAKQIYTYEGFRSDEPGTTWAYNSYHLQIALGMACKATGLSAREVLQKFLYDPAGMKHTTWTGVRNPFMAGGYFSNGYDTDRFLRALLSYKLLPKDIVDEMNTEVVAAQGLKVRVGLPIIEDMYPMKAYNFAMGHVVDKMYEGPPPVALTREISWWRGATGWAMYIDYEAGIYMAVLQASYTYPDPISAVFCKVYAALELQCPVAGPAQQVANTEPIAIPLPSETGPHEAEGAETATTTTTATTTAAATSAEIDGESETPNEKASQEPAVLESGAQDAGAEEDDGADDVTWTPPEVPAE